jgi:hypothetical protein
MFQGNFCRNAAAASPAGGERNFGWSAAPKAIPVPLLPSGPGGVRGTLSHRARSSTLRQPRFTKDKAMLRGKSLAQALCASEVPSRDVRNLRESLWKSQRWRDEELRRIPRAALLCVLRVNSVGQSRRSLCG